MALSRVPKLRPLQKCVCGRNVIVWSRKFRKEVPFNLRVSQRTLSIYRRYTWWNVSMQQISAKCQPTSRICTMKMTFEGHNFPFFGQENLLFVLRESYLHPLWHFCINWIYITYLCRSLPRLWDGEEPSAPGSQIGRAFLLEIMPIWETKSWVGVAKVLIMVNF